MAKYNIPNLYIANRDRASSGGGSDPQLESRVEALETTVDGTGGLSDQVDELDEQINGDSTATPPVPGIVDEIEALEASVFGDSTATPPVLGIVDQLTASNDVPFRFGYDSTTQKYGYILDVGGADTVIPFSSGSSLIDINPNKTDSTTIVAGVNTPSVYSYMPVQGYSKVYLHGDTTTVSMLSFSFVKTDSTETTPFTVTNAYAEYTVPSDAVLLKITGTYSSAGYAKVYYSLEV